MFVLFGQLHCVLQDMGEHLQQLEGVFECLQQAKLKVEASKCALPAPNLNYMWHQVMKDGLLPDPSLLQAIQDIAKSQDVKELRHFLGLASYYRQYVKGFPAIDLPLHALTKKDDMYHWIPKCQDAFFTAETLVDYT